LKIEVELYEPLKILKRRQNAMLPEAVLKRAVSGTTGIDSLVRQSTEMFLYGWIQHMAINYVKTNKPYAKKYFETGKKKRFPLLLEFSITELAKELKLKVSSINYNLNKLVELGVIAKVKNGHKLVNPIYLLGFFKFVKFPSKDNPDDKIPSIQCNWKFKTNDVGRCKRLIKKIDNGYYKIR